MPPEIAHGNVGIVGGLIGECVGDDEVGDIVGAQCVSPLDTKTHALGKSGTHSDIGMLSLHDILYQQLDVFNKG